VLWHSGSGTVAEVREELPAELAYTTVLTILRNLEAKGFVRHEPRGKAHRYFPVVAKQAARKSALTRVLDGLFHSSPEELIAHLVEERALTRAQLRRLGSHLTSPALKRRGRKKK